MDLFKRHWKKEASQKALILTGRTITAIFVLIGCFIMAWRRYYRSYVDSLFIFW